MIYTSGLNSFSDGSEVEDGPETNTYKRKYILLLQKCNKMRLDNERLVLRIHNVKKLTRRYRKERKYLMDRLDVYNDDWRNANYELLPEPEKSHSDLTLSNLLDGSPQVGSSNSSKTPSNSTEKTPGSKGKGMKRRGEKAEKDPNAPKRPANPFFQFCQEQRSKVLDKMTSTGQSEPTKQELTKQLANTWNTLSNDDKKVYYSMYEKSKEKYAAELEQYSLNKVKNESTMQTK